MGHDSVFGLQLRTGRFLRSHRFLMAACNESLVMKVNARVPVVDKIGFFGRKTLLLVMNLLLVITKTPAELA